MFLRQALTLIASFFALGSLLTSCSDHSKVTQKSPKTTSRVFVDGGVVQEKNNPSSGSTPSPAAQNTTPTLPVTNNQDVPVPNTPPLVFTNPLPSTNNQGHTCENNGECTPCIEESIPCQPIDCAPFQAETPKVQEEDCEFCDCESDPTKSNCYVFEMTEFDIVEVSKNSAVLHISTNIPAKLSRVFVYPVDDLQESQITGGGTLFSPDLTFKTQRVYLLEGLNPDTTYKVALKFESKLENYLVPGERFFSTPSIEEPSFNEPTEKSENNFFNSGLSFCEDKVTHGIETHTILIGDKDNFESPDWTNFPADTQLKADAKTLYEQKKIEPKKPGFDIAQDLMPFDQIGVIDKYYLAKLNVPDLEGEIVCFSFKLRAFDNKSLLSTDSFTISASEDFTPMHGWSTSQRSSTWSTGKMDRKLQNWESSDVFIIEKDLSSYIAPNGVSFVDSLTPGNVIYIHGQDDHSPDFIEIEFGYLPKELI